jgi:hypothetical protein
MKKILPFIAVLFSINSFSQNIFFDDFSSYNLGKIDGQNGYSTATPSLGNGTGSCVGIGCIYSKIVDMTMSHPALGNPTKALLCSDTTNFQTADGPGKSLGKTINTGAVYVAILVNCYQQNGTGSSKQIVRLMDNGFNVPCRIYVRNGSGGSVQFGISKSSGGTTWGANTYNTNQDYLIVMKYEFKTGSTSNDVVSVFIDPDLSLAEPTTPTFFISGNSDAIAITRVVFPWNSSSTVFNGYIGINSVAQSWATIIPQTTTAYSITGRTISAKKVAVQTSKITLTSISSKDSTNTNVDGNYSFNNLITNDYTIRLLKNNDISKANGINATDVLFTQRHILNTTKLNSAYKLIAADVTGDKVVNATDVLRIKRLILGTDTTFTKGAGANKVDRLWEFVDSAYVFPDTTNPFPFKDSISFTNLTSNKINQTFIGVKLGDVNYDWNPAVAKGSIIDNVELIIDNAAIKVDKQLSTVNYQLPIKVKNFKDIVAMQYTLHFDNKDYEFVGIENNKLDIDFNSKQANQNGNISFLWTDKNAVERSLEDGTEVFTLVLRSTVNGKPSTDVAISLTNDLTEIAAWDKDYNQHNIILTQKSKIETQNLNDVWSVSPNPTSGNIKVSIVSKNNKTVSFELTDAQGKTILKQSVELQKGNNNFTINLKKNGNLTTGIYFLKAIGVEGENVKRIMVK